LVQFLARNDKIDISNCTKFIVVAFGPIVDYFEFELWMSILIALAPSLKVRCEFVICHHIDCFQIGNTLKVVYHPFDNRLTTDDEQRLYARLAVFRGGCALAAAEQIADADLDTLQSLVDKSLLRHSQERFWMLETIREYAAERVDSPSRRNELHRSHAEHFLEIAQHARTDDPVGKLEALETLLR